MIDKFLKLINSKENLQILTDFYGNDSKILKKQKERYINLTNNFVKIFKDNNFHVFSTAGRTEICGNHTDHNLGKVIAASITLDSIACASPNDDNKAIVFSKFYNKKFEVNLDSLDPIDKEAGTTESLIRGVAKGFKKEGYTISGFNAYIDSDVLPGSGLSSSASFEVLIGTIFNGLFNNLKMSPIDMAKIGKFAENEYMKKPCGLMDQVSCALGGIITIDFENQSDPKVKKIDFDFNKYNYSLLVIDTGGSHADLTPSYASIPMEMKSVANYFGKIFCRELELNDIIRSVKNLRDKTGDRAILRAIHYLEENKRVDQMIKSLENKDFNEFLNLINQSGNSSWKLLQNCYSLDNPRIQGVTLALSLTEIFINKIKKGACRVHGGGFAGTILAIIPNEHIADYIKMIENVFTKGSVKKLGIRQNGTMMIF